MCVYIYFTKELFIVITEGTFVPPAKKILNPSPVPHPHPGPASFLLLSRDPSHHRDLPVKVAHSVT
jgi:hypothetical protein